MKEVYEFIKSLKVKKNEKVIVACSGGPDSMMLLSLLHELKFDIVCAHVNHNVRKESDLEYEFVNNYCNDNNIIFEGTKIDNVPKTNFEQFGREFRYNFLKGLVNKYNVRYVFTAHHADDLIETILMRITRGSSLLGYSGFSNTFKRDNYIVVRPLIYLTKDEIIRYNEENDIEYAIDITNFEDDHTRNRFRNHIVPLLKKEDKNVHKKILKYSNTLKEYYDYVNKDVYNYLNKIYKNDILDLNEYNKIDSKLIKRCILEEIIRKYYPDNLYLINDKNIDEIIKIIDSKKTNIKVELPNNLEVIKEYDKLIFLKKEEINNFYYIYDNYLETPSGVFKTVKESDDSSNYTIRLNSKSIKLPIIIRTRKNGDKIEIKNMNGSKKINDIFIDSKLTKRNRDLFPIVTDSNNQILWLPGLKKSKFDISKSSDYDIIIEYEKKENK